MPGKQIAGGALRTEARFPPLLGIGYHARVKFLIADFCLLIENQVPKGYGPFNQQSAIKN